MPASSTVYTFSGVLATTSVISAPSGNLPSSVVAHAVSIVTSATVSARATAANARSLFFVIIKKSSLMPSGNKEHVIKTARCAVTGVSSLARGSYSEFRARAGHPTLAVSRIR